MNEQAAQVVRLGVVPDPNSDSGCVTCGHPFSLHGNGTTGCKALRCAGGPSAECQSCGGTTVNLVTCQPCEACNGKGTVPTACPSFAAVAPPGSELIAS